MLEVYVADSLHGCARVTLFNQAVDSYHRVVSPSATCYFSGGRIKRAFTSNNGVKISFGSSADIHRAPDQLAIVPRMSDVPLTDLAALAEGSTATTIAVVHALGALKRLVTKRGKTAEKRELLLVDDSGSSMVCTTWNQLARDSGDVPEGTIVVVKNGILSTYNNLRSASIGAGSDVLHDPALARADQLREWYNSLPPDHVFSPLTLN